MLQYSQIALAAIYESRFTESKGSEIFVQ